MEYNFKEIELYWRSFWAENNTYKVTEDSTKDKFYALDMFPYPSGAGLHVGHPLGYIASDIYSRYKRLLGFNVLHPMGYDSFGLPAEQYAIQTGQHPAVTTEENIKRYREQLDKIGFSFDWSREVRTSSPDYYKWTQWIFKELYNSYYDTQFDRAKGVDELCAIFEKEGNSNVFAVTDYSEIFTAEAWNGFDKKQKEAVLQNYRLAYLADSWVNWCPALGTVLANDEVVNGVSERGGHSVEQKLMRQWSMRIKAYAERLLTGLDTIDWSESIKEQQRNWIGKSTGASVFFSLKNSEDKIEVFTTRPDTIFGVTFVVIAPEHPLVEKLTTSEFAEQVAAYKKASSLKSERDRQADVKNITGQFTGAYVEHPFTLEPVPVWIGDYVLASYGTGAVMAVPCGDQRDHDFAKHFDIEIRNIFEAIDVNEKACVDKEVTISNSDFLSGLKAKDAIVKAISEIEKRGLGKGKTNYRLRDAVFSRQRYWGEPFPVYYENEVPQLFADAELPVTLPKVDKYLPTEDGEPPLARAKKEDWDQYRGDHMEYNTMPGWAGSSWYFLRYMDPQNQQTFASRTKIEYWGQVDLYIGGSEHATGHLLYSRFWTKFLFDKGYLPFEEPFKKLINQGMILGRSSFVYRIKNTNQFVSYHQRSAYDTTSLHVDISLVDNDKLDIEAFKKWRSEFSDATFITETDGTYVCGYEVEKMSKSKYNVQTPDELIEKFGADTLRMYEMFLGPIEQSKPWDTKGINGVHNFLRRFWRLFFNNSGELILNDEQATKAAMKSLHKTIKKMTDDLERFSFNTCVSNLMICVNELTDENCHSRSVLEPLTILLAPFAPHLSEELWSRLGHQKGSVSDAVFPKFDAKYLQEESFAYPVSFNGKMRLKVELPMGLSISEIEQMIVDNQDVQKWMEGKAPKKMIVVPGKIVNIVL
jgi:leucyl-tRNA synthetase